MKKLIVLGLLLGANLLVPQILRADICCNFCGSGQTLDTTTRPAPCSNFECKITLCTSGIWTSANCSGGLYECNGNVKIDNCDFFIPCGA